MLTDLVSIRKYFSFGITEHKPQMTAPHTTFWMNSAFSSKHVDKFHWIFISAAVLVRRLMWFFMCLVNAVYKYARICTLTGCMLKKAYVARSSPKPTFNVFCQL